MGTIASKASISASELNRRIRIELPVSTPDDEGGIESSWQVVPGCESVPASMTPAPIPKTGDEKFVHQQLYATRMAIFKIRYRPSTNIADTMRIVYGSRIFKVRSVSVPGEARLSIIIYAEEQQAKGSVH